MLRYRFSLLLFFAVLLLTSASQTLAQSDTLAKTFVADDSSEPRLLRALLDEMRQLRLSLEINNLRQLRATTVLERIKRQETRINTLNSDIEISRKQMREISNAERYNDELEELKEVEKAINETDDACARAQLTQEYARLKHSLERKKKAESEELERLRTLEPQLNTQLQTELARLADLDNQLEKLERELDQEMADSEKTRIGRK